MSSEDKAEGKTWLRGITLRGEKEGETKGGHLMGGKLDLIVRQRVK